MRPFYLSVVLVFLLGRSVCAQTGGTSVYFNHLSVSFTGTNGTVRRAISGYTIINLDQTNGLPTGIQLLAWTHPSRQFMVRTNRSMSRYDLLLSHDKPQLCFAQAYNGQNSVATFFASGNYQTLFANPNKTVYWQGPNPVSWKAHAVYPAPGINIVEDMVGTLTLDVGDTFASQAGSAGEAASFLSGILQTQGYVQVTDYLK